MKRFLGFLLSLLFALPVGAQLAQVPPPGAYQIKQGDALIFNCTGITGFLTNVSYQVSIRILTTQGERKDLQSVISGAPCAAPDYTKYFFTSEGWLIAANITQTGTALAPNGQYGSNWPQLFLQRSNGQLPNAAPITLIACNTSTNYSQSWPNSGCSQPVQYAGAIQDLNITQPAAGSNATFTFNGLERYLLSNIRIQLVSAVAAASRQVCAKFTDAGGNIYLERCFQGTQTLSQTDTYDFSAGGNNDLLTAATLLAIPNNDEVQSGLPTNLQLNDGTTLTIVVLNIQAADQLSLGVIRVEAKHEFD